MKVTLRHHTPLWVCSTAIRTCWDSHDKSDSFMDLDGEIICGDKDKELIDRVGNKFKHSSTLEHLVYSFRIEGVSRALLQELARHRMSSPSVKSTRYTLKQLLNVELFNKDLDGSFDDIDWNVAREFLVMTPDKQTNINSVYTLQGVKERLQAGVSNDYAKFGLPENFKTELSWTINARSLANFLNLRSGASAMWEIRNLANAIFEEIPEEHKFIFESGIITKVDDGE